ncbi:hypothetical protein BGZ59_008221 [Podila verticillata]|nr:hypothetical protein BGZ59_008221 [Podila verticillata]KAI9232013.1 MAG: hypothetical protein BYD32DRAFT_441342 [Podila humilis]KFH73191.1 hypothetical protein MVEG_00412 [Podila verticillata NRRL 6337]
MSLLKTAITLQSVLILFCLGNFGLDLFFIKTYVDNWTVVFLWPFYAQTGITGLFLLLFITHVIVLHVRRRRLNRQAHPSIHYPRASPGFTTILGAVVRAIFCFCLVVGMLYTTIKCIRDNSRSAFEIPFRRDSAQARPYNEHFDSFAPHNLFQCPDTNNSGSLDLLCNFDKSTMLLGTVIAVLAFFELLVTFALSFQGTKEYEGDFDHSQHVGLKDYPQGASA